MTPRAALGLALGFALVVAFAAMPPYGEGVSRDVHRGLLVALLGLLALAQARFGLGRERLGLGALLFLPPLLVGFLQLLPWPVGALDRLAPSLAGLLRADAAAGGRELGAHALTPDPASSLRTLLLGVAYLVAYMIARGRRRSRALALSALATTTLVGLWGVAALGLTPTPHWAGRASGPFVNPNHLCAYLAIGLCLAIGLVGSRAKKEIRLLAAACALTLVVALVATRSRAGIVAALLGVACALAVQGVATRRRAFAAALGVAVLVTGLVLSDREPLQERFAATTPERTGLALEARAETWQIALARIRGAPLLGEGLGSFDLQSQALLDPERRRWTRPGSAHDDYLELASDVGIPAALLAIAGAIALLGRGFVRTRRTVGTPRAIRAGALGGLVAVLAHSLLDFPLQQPGVALLAITCLGLLQGSDRVEHKGRRGRVAFALLGLGLVAGGAWLAYQGYVEQRSRQAYAKVRAVRPALRGEQVQRLKGDLRAATRLGARAEPHALLGAALATRATSLALTGKGEEEVVALRAESLRALRAAVEASPGDARFQLQLATLLLAAGPHEEEARRRVLIALERGPAQPTILFGAAEAALELRTRTGQAADLELAERCLRRALLQRPGEAKRARAIVERYTAKLGRRADVLAAKLKEFEAAAKGGP